MSKKKRPDLDEMNQELEKLKARKKVLQREVKYQDSIERRKQRTFRLVRTGALVEKYFKIEHLTIEEREEVFKIFSPYIKQNMPNKFRKKE
ncbi:hypothetical protein QK289_14280 [Exiguobacterium antarcticum]|uniref:Relaxasome subunit MobC n=1 Tax=Exiguobacterium antarcticum TaxID=132920 RepID=A0ABT6R5U2_9BACL|nr:hypothetical protein [Exiguobacterium antarcticum]MDI3236178.1 hypothetical protein [Exiguobacterium antarcticum]